MITLVNYGVGNINAVVSSMRSIGQEIVVATTKQEMTGATKLILPGVGSFAKAMHRLNKSGMREVLEKLVIEKSTPILGICVGMQMLTKSSAEGNAEGLGWLDAKVLKLEQSDKLEKLILPHMGYNSVVPSALGSKLLNNMLPNPLFYFLHSYYVSCNNLNLVSATTSYPTSFSSVINFENIYGVQFHPEKSHANGLKLLKNFIEI